MSSSPKIEVVVEKCCTTTGEGPHWDEESQSLWHVDIVAGGVHKWDSATNKETKTHLDGSVGFVIPREKGGLVIGLNRTISVLDWNTKDVQVLAEVEAGTKNRFNDAKCDAAGRLWAGTMGHMENPATFERHKGNLYCLSTDLNLTKQESNIDISNGLAWTDDNKVMYYIDSIPRKVIAYDYDFDAGTISNSRVAIDFEKEGTPGVPDGMCIDCDGKLWVACFGGSQVTRFDPETGKTLQSLSFPAKDITSVCFGGKNLDELFVTCNAWKLFGDKDQPLAGSIFKVSGLGVKGKAPNKFKG